jgi:NADH-quinone oxidoreductase E subunit
VFPDPLGRELDAVVARYPKREAAMLPVLTRLQAERGFLSDDTLREVASYLEVTEAAVVGVVTFYSMYDRHPVGRNKVYVCRTLSCRLRGAEDVTRALEEKLHIRRGETTADGRVTLVPFECLGLCDMAPCALVGNRRFGPLDPNSIDSFLEQLK